MLSKGSHILRDPGAASWDDRMFAVKVYYKIEKSSWALSLTESVPEAFKLHASDWPISEEEQPGDSGVFLHDVGFLIGHDFFILVRSKFNWESFWREVLEKKKLR